MDLAGRVRKSDFRRSAVLFGGGKRGADIARIVKRVEYTDNVYAVFNGLFAEQVHHVVGVMLVTQKVLTAQKHLKFGVGDSFSQCAQSFPRVFVKIS